MSKYLASVVVVTYERLLATRRCFESLLECTKDFELVVVDNSSRPEIVDLVKSLPGIKVLLPENLGLYKALNIGVGLTSCDVVAFLDCDIVVRPGWLESLRAELLADTSIGLAGSRYLNSDDSLQEGFPVLRSDGWYGDNSIDLRTPRDAQYIAIGCSAWRKSAWSTVGGFDENYFISHGDIDFCYKLRYEAGLRVRYCPNSTVVHDHEYGKEPDYETIRFSSEICDADFQIFKRKWQNRYEREMVDPISG